MLAADPRDNRRLAGGGELDATPFSTWTLPGLALLVLVALPQLALAVLSAVGDPRAIFAGYLCGAALIGWIVVQLGVTQPLRVGGCSVCRRLLAADPRDNRRLAGGRERGAGTAPGVSGGGRPGW